MTDAAAVADVETMPEEPQVVTKNEKKTDRRNKPKRQPPYAVILHNDDDHTFLYVAELLMKIFGYPVEKAAVLTEQVHFSGRAIVWTGSMEVAELKRDQVVGYGPDFYASKPVRFPLGVTIEPLPE